VWQAGPVPPRPATARATFDRAEALERMRHEAFDVVVIGGGVTGAGVALDAASRGLRTALVERDDFASGTSSKSSKMVHGGIRYLQQRDFRLVYEALHERQRLLDNAPHLVSPLPFLIPLFGRDGVVQKSVARAYATALWTYDMTGGLRIGKRHRRVDRSEALAHFPTLRADRLVAAFLYFDARADDARLTLALARTAAAHGAALANGCRAVGLRRDAGGRLDGVQIRAAGPNGDNRGGDGEEIEVRAPIVVNATGVWSDDVRALDEATHPHSIRPAKGIHVTVSRDRLPADIAAVVPVPGDRRSIFVVPWPDGDDVYLGTTDTEWNGPLDDPACLPEDVDYLLAAANATFAQPVTRQDVTGVWAGLRPLLAPTGGRTLSARTADLSRRHTVHVSADGLVTVTGGKLTTYRRMAEDTVDAALRWAAGRGGRLSVRAGKTATRRLRLVGADGLEELDGPDAARRLGVDEPTLLHLRGRYGGETPAVLDLASGRPELLDPLVGGLPYLAVEAVWAVRREMARTLDDVLSRRTRAALRRAEATAEAAPVMAALLAPEWQRDADAGGAEAAAWAAGRRQELRRAGLEPTPAQGERRT
jgi:glycerol-3-phosphate dehydrogenase